MLLLIHAIGGIFWTAASADDPISGIVFTWGAQCMCVYGGKLPPGAARRPMPLASELGEIPITYSFPAFLGALVWLLQ